MKQIRFTQSGYKKLQDELAALIKQRPAVVEDLKKAREMGDLSENGYYKASRAKLSWVDGSITRSKYYLKNAVIVEDDGGNNTIDIGSNVVLSDGKKEIHYEIVGDMEANPSEGKLSLLSPIGKALTGKKAGDTVEFSMPAGTITYKILSLS